MAGKFTRLQKTYKIMDSDGVSLYTGVVMSGENECIKPTADNQLPLGVVDNDERLDDPLRAGGDQTGKQVAVKLEGIAMLRLAEPVAVGERVILAVGGEGKTITGLTAGTVAEVLGFAEKDGQAGDVIPVRMNYHTFTVA